MKITFHVKDLNTYQLANSIFFWLVASDRGLSCHVSFPFTHIWLTSAFGFFLSHPLVYCLTSILSCWGTNFSNHRNGFLWWKTHNERGWISIVGRMQLNKHYAAQTQWYLKSCSKSPISLSQMLEADKRVCSQEPLLYSVSASFSKRNCGKANGL